MQNVAALVMLYMTLKLKPGNWYKTGQANGALSLSPSDFCPVDVYPPYFHFCVMLSLLAFAGAGDVPSACTTDQLCISWSIQSTI